MKKIEVLEEVWDDLVGKAEVGERVNDVLMRVLGIQEAIANKSLQEVIDENPDFLKQFIGIYNKKLSVICGDSTGTWKLEPKYSIDKMKVINEAVNCLMNASICDGENGRYPCFCLDASDADRQAVEKYITRMLVEYYFES